VIFAQDPSAVTNVWGFAALLVFAAFGVVNTYLQILGQREQRLAAGLTAAKVAEVKFALVDSDVQRQTQLVDLQQVGEKTKDTVEKVHTLVNSVHGMALRSNATLAARIAELTGLEEDRVAANKAAAVLREHELKQSRVDAGISTSGNPS
jgi:hypothetical protein